jgi:hypothetical protein
VGVSSDDSIPPLLPPNQGGHCVRRHIADRRHKINPMDTNNAALAGGHTGRWMASWCPIISAMFAVLLWASLPSADIARLTSEGGPVERTSQWLYFVMAAVFAFGARLGASAKTRAALVVLMLAFGAREMDLHKYWAGKSVLKLSFYLGSAPAHQKVVALALLAAIALALVTLLRRHGVEVWRGLRVGRPVSTTVVITKILDRSVNTLAEDFGVLTPPSIGVLVGALEEIMELTPPMIAAIGWWQVSRSRPLD